MSRIALTLVLLLLPALSIADSLTDQVDAVFAGWSKPGTPGCAVGVSRGSEVVYQRGYGMANLEHMIPIKPDTTFYLASVSKQFTAAATLLLADEGKLSLDDSVRKHVPELPAYADAITVRHLLHHTSGLRDYLDLLSMAGARGDDYYTSNDEFLSIVARQKALNFRPGDEHLYSNSGYVLLSILARRLSGKTLRQYADEKIFQPLGMKSTHYHDDRQEVLPRRATGYTRRATGEYRINSATLDVVGDGGMFSTVEDMHRWAAALFGRKLGGGDFLQRMLERTRLNDGEEISYSRGLVHAEHKGLRAVVHGGGLRGYVTDFVHFPEQQLTITCLCNASDARASQYTRRIADIYLANEIAAAPAKQKPRPQPRALVDITVEELRRLGGHYRNLKTGDVQLLAVDEPGKALIAGNTRLGANGRLSFHSINSPNPVRAVFDVKPGAPVRVSFDVEGQKPSTWERAELAKLTAADLRAYAGTYRSEEVGSTVVVRLEKDELWAQLGARPAARWQPTLRDRFTQSGTRIEFTRDANGRISGFTATTGRARNVLFRKSGSASPPPP